MRGSVQSVEVQKCWEAGLNTERTTPNNVFKYHNAKWSKIKKPNGVEGIE
jgi:hypothetical protein